MLLCGLSFQPINVVQDLDPMPRLILDCAVYADHLVSKPEDARFLGYVLSAWRGITSDRASRLLLTFATPHRPNASVLTDRDIELKLATVGAKKSSPGTLHGREWSAYSSGEVGCVQSCRCSWCPLA